VAGFTIADGVGVRNGDPIRGLAKKGGAGSMTPIEKIAELRAAVAKMRGRRREDAVSSLIHVALAAAVYRESIRNPRGYTRTARAIAEDNLDAMLAVVARFAGAKEET
jgi:hypothetical protein